MEKATGIVREVAIGKRIEQVETFEDEIVFAGITHEEFVSRNSTFWCHGCLMSSCKAKEITNRTVNGADRYGSYTFPVHSSLNSFSYTPGY